VEFHRRQGATATLTAVQPPGRFGAFNLAEGQTTIQHFREKQHEDGAWVNGGFFVMEPEVMDYINGDETVLEQQPMQQLAKEGKLSAYRHCGYWQNMIHCEIRSVR
jgi:glucose-1-phosphate cytidylyltransferase